MKWAEGDPPHASADIFMDVDQGSTVNTLTLVLQVSHDNSNWYNHAASSALMTDNAADIATYSAVTINGLYFRVAATVANTETVTPTIRVVLR